MGGKLDGDGDLGVDRGRPDNEIHSYISSTLLKRIFSKILKSAATTTTTPIIWVPLKGFCFPRKSGGC